MSAITIRPLRSEDAEDLQRLVNAPGVRYGTMQLGIATVMEQRGSIESLTTTPNCSTLGAEVDGQLVGLVVLNGTANPRGRHAASLGIFVRDDYIGQGIGTALMAEIVDLADNWLNLHRIELDVNVDNPAAIHLYETFGFVREGVKRDYIFRAGSYVDCLVMARLRSR